MHRASEQHGSWLKGGGRSVMGGVTSLPSTRCYQVSLGLLLDCQKVDGVSIWFPAFGVRSASETLGGSVTCGNGPSSGI